MRRFSLPALEQPRAAGRPRTAPAGWAFRLPQRAGRALRCSLLLSLAAPLGAGLLASTLAAPPAFATVLVPLDLPTLTRRSERAARVEVISEESRWTEGHDAIFTDVTVRVVQPYKGAEPGETFVVRREGGTVHGVTMRVYGAALLRVGEEAILFAERRGSSLWVTGMSQGRLRVVRDAAGQASVLAAELQGAELQGAVTRRPARQPLSEFERELTALVASQRSGR